MTYLGALGLIMVIVMMIFLLRGKNSPAIPFVLVPVVFAALAGFGIGDISKFAVEGISKVSNVAVLFIGTITYFGIMGDAGMFDPLVHRLVRFADKGVISIFFATSAIAMITHLDGSGASTYLLTIPIMLPLYEKFKIRKLDLLLTTALMAGVMNLVPWGGPFVRVGSVLGIDPNICWNQMLLTQIFGVVLAFVFSFFLAKRALKYGAGKNLESSVTAEDAIANAADLALKRPHLALINWLVTIFILLCLFKGWVPSHLLFLFGTVVALLFNYRGAEEQGKRIKAHAAQVMSMVIIVITSGVFLGIFAGTEMVTEMVVMLVNIMPSFLTPILHIVVGLFAAPLGMLIGADPYVYGMLPVIMGVTETAGVSAISTAIAVVLGECAGWTISPAVSTVYLGCGLIDCDLKDWLKHSVLIVWGFTVVLLAFAVVTGAV